MPPTLLSHKKIFDRFLKREQPILSSWAFVNVFGWQDFFRFEFKEIEKRLCVFAHYELGCFLYLPPLGGVLTKKCVAKCFEYMDGFNRNKSVSRIENIDAEQVKFFDSDYRINLKANEYVYCKSDLISLKGNAFKSKRHDINLFKKSYVAELVPFKLAMLKECQLLYDAWAQAKRSKSTDDIFLSMLEDNRRVHALTMRLFKKLDLVGRVVIVDGKIAGYTFGFVLNKSTFCVLFEVVNPAMKGLPSFIFHEFCADSALKKFSFINVMDDFGLENISRTKNSYRPSELLPSYVVTKKF